MIEPIEEQPGFFRVCLGGGTYVVAAETGQCSCPAWEHRCSRTPGALCKHGRALAAHLAAERACEACGGRGFFVPRCRYPSMQPIECAQCSGSGLRQPEPMTDAYRRDLFA
jgi:hypothetical protein